MTPRSRTVNRPKPRVVDSRQPVQQPAVPPGPKKGPFLKIPLSPWLPWVGPCALGVDTAALATAGALAQGGPRLVVTVPFSLSDQPVRARQIIEQHADEVRELGLSRSRAAYLDRNRAMLEGAQRLLAFTDGRNRGGTCHTIGEALRRGLEVDLVEVCAVPGSSRRQGDFCFDLEGPTAKARWEEVVTGDRYRSVLSDPGHEMSCRVRRLVAGRATEEDSAALTDELVSLVERHAGLRESTAITAAPGRLPGEPGPMAPLPRALAERTVKAVLWKTGSCTRPTRAAGTAPTATPPRPRPTPAPSVSEVPSRTASWSWTPSGPWAASWRGPSSPPAGTRARDPRLWGWPYSTPTPYRPEKQPGPAHHARAGGRARTAGAAQTP